MDTLVISIVELPWCTRSTFRTASAAEWEGESAFGGDPRAHGVVVHVHATGGALTC